MKLKINDVWSISSDPLCWILEEQLPPGLHPITKELGKVGKVNCTYHGALLQALNFALDRMMIQSDSLEELRVEVSNYLEDIAALAEKFPQGLNSD